MLVWQLCRESFLKYTYTHGIIEIEFVVSLEDREE